MTFLSAYLHILFLFKYYIHRLIEEAYFVGKDFSQMQNDFSATHFLF